MATTQAPPATAQETMAKTPLCILKYRLPARGRRRKHMALFIPDPDSTRVQAPSVTKRPWIANEIRNCQDWLADLAHELHRHGVVNEECVEAIQAQIDPPVALLPAPSGGQVSAQQQQSVITASMGPGSFASLPAAPPKAEKTEWVAERKRFRRWNQLSEQLVYLFQGRGGEREWRPEEGEGGKE